MSVISEHCIWLHLRRKLNVNISCFLFHFCVLLVSPGESSAIPFHFIAYHSRPFYSPVHTTTSGHQSNSSLSFDSIAYFSAESSLSRTTKIHPKISIQNTRTSQLPIFIVVVVFGFGFFFTKHLIQIISMKTRQTNK